MKKVVGKPHPNIFKLIEVIKRGGNHSDENESLRVWSKKVSQEKESKNPDSLSEVQWRKHQY